MIDTEKPPLGEAYLEHVGVKGMKWGVRKDRASGTGTSGAPAGAKKEPRFSPEQKARAKQVAIGAGILLAVAGAAYAGQKVDLKIPMAALKGAAIDAGKKAAVDAGKKAVEKMAMEQTGVIHAARQKERGFRFHQKGGVPDPMSIYESAGFGEGSNKGFHVRTLSDGKVASRFPDPEGRKDRAGRDIEHEVIVPKAMADGVKTLNDVETKIWPQIKDDYNAGFTAQPKGFGAPPPKRTIKEETDDALEIMAGRKKGTINL